MRPRIGVSGENDLTATTSFPHAHPRLQLLDMSLLKLDHMGKPVTMHLFERTIELSKSRSQREYYLPMQVVFALKEKNGGKLNSHLW